MAGSEKIKAKGVSKPVIKNHLTIDDHKRCLFGEEIDPYRVMKSIRSYKHEVKTISTEKLALNRQDDKRYVLEDSIHTLAHGHYRIEYVNYLL